MDGPAAEGTGAACTARPVLMSNSMMVPVAAEEERVETPSPTRRARRLPGAKGLADTLGDALRERVIEPVAVVEGGAPAESVDVVVVVAAADSEVDLVAVADSVGVMAAVADSEVEAEDE